MLRSRMDTARNAEISKTRTAEEMDAFRALVENRPNWTPDKPLLSLRGLNVSFLVGTKLVDIVHDLDLDIMPGSVVCIVGETGCGKSVTATAALHLLPDNARVSGSILFKGVEVSGLSDDDFRHLRRTQLMNIPQNPSTSLNPLMRVGPQVAECADDADVEGGSALGRSGQKKMLKDAVVKLFGRLSLPNPQNTYRKYPSELSGGMNQRVLISMGAIAHPDLLVVDEPTKAIDWSLRRDVLEMLQGLKRETSCAMMLITHDIPFARLIADQVAVMYAGRIVELGPGDEVLNNPIHPYTMGLLNSLPENDFKAMDGFMPSFDDLPQGCSFWPRCPYAGESCKSGLPPAMTFGGRTACCHHPLVEGDAR